MGGKERALEFSEKLSGGDTFVKRWLFQIFHKCGNCQYRLNCWIPVLNSKGNLADVYTTVFNCDGVKRKGDCGGPITSDGKHAARLIKHCSGCIQVWHCCFNVVVSEALLGLSAVTSRNPDAHLKAIRRCAGCARTEQCFSGLLKDIGFTFGAKARIVGVLAKCAIYGRSKK